MKTLLPLEQKFYVQKFGFWSGIKITGTHLTSAGFTLNLDKKPDISIAYADVKLADLKNNYVGAVAFDIPDGQHILSGAKETRDQFFVAFRHLVDAAYAGRPCDCTRYLIDIKTALDTFAQQTTAWRTAATKPALSDEVIKKRLLAEDAMEHKNLQTAVTYYEAGVALDPTWAQGWYNAGLLYAEQQDYFDAAFYMKHYLILLPDAPDAAAAKEKLLLWEAKEEEARGK
ncbi:MAG: hypothetical protein WCC87_11580 [Candidatus Korobacteraceae bacterium]